MKRSLTISSTGRKNAPLFSPAAALRHGRRQTRNAVSDFDEFLPEKFGKGKDLHLRPIKNRWAALKQAVYAGGYPLPGQVPRCFAAPNRRQTPRS